MIRQWIFWGVLFFLFASCQSQIESRRLDRIEAVAHNDADSVLTLLANMDVPAAKENLARYTLLTAYEKYRRYDTEFDIDALEQAYLLLKDSRSSHLRALIYYVHAAICEQLKLGDEEQHALDYFAAAKAVEQSDDSVLAAQIYQRIANAMNQRKMVREALHWGEKYREEAAKTGNAKEEAVALLQLAMAHCWESDSIVESNHELESGYNESIALSHEALRIASKANDPDAMMRAYDKLSTFHSRKQNPDSALHYAIIADSLIYVVESQMPTRQKRAHSTLADAYRKVGTRMRAEYEKTHDPDLLKQIRELAQKAIAIVETDLNSDFTTAQKVTSAQLGYLINKNVLKDVDQALYYMQRYNDLKYTLEHESQNTRVMSAPIRIEKEEVEATLDKTQNWLWWLIAALFAVTLCGSTAIIWISRNNRKELIRLQDELNEALSLSQVANGNSAESEEADRRMPDAADTGAAEEMDEEPILIEGTTNEHLRVKPSDILSITSEGNYIKIIYLDSTNGSLSTKHLRATMKVMEELLLPYTDIVRCHRAFMVNLNHVRQTTTSSAGLTLILDTADLVIPVSRSYVSSIKASLLSPSVPS